jgi:hypothetical protein
MRSMGRICGWRVLLGAIIVLAAGCQSIHESEDFKRHRYSQLSEPSDRNDVLYFDVQFDVNYPSDDPVAEEIRMSWLTAWLDARNMCADGHRIADQRPFDTMEYNPGQYDRRYEVKCKVVAH